MKRIVSTTFIICGILSSFIFYPNTYAATYGVSCYCGVHLGPGATNKDCIRACGDEVSTQEPSSSRGYHDNKDYGRQQWEEQQKLEWERLRQQEIQEKEARKKREEKRKRQFEQDKQKAIDMLKSTTGKQGIKTDPASAPKLKSSSPSGTGLKQSTFSKGSKGSAPPYLGGLDSKWPIVVDPLKVQDGTPEALYAANRKTHVLLDALEANPNDWEGSIRYLKNRLADSPNDLAVRDALNLVRGYYAGHLRAKKQGDNYYRHGVRKWLEGDFNLAASSFAFAYEQNPDDRLLLRSFAYALGIRNSSGRCEGRATCSFIGYPSKTLDNRTGMDAEVRRKLKETKAVLKSAPENLTLRATVNYLEGLAGFQNYQGMVLGETRNLLDDNATKYMKIGLKKLGEKRYVEGWQEYAKAFNGISDERHALFAISYAKGLAASERGDIEHMPDSHRDQRTERVYEMELIRMASSPEQDIDAILEEMLIDLALGPSKVLAI
jgi:hypothetical protein